MDAASSLRLEHAGEDNSSAERDARRLRNGVIWTVVLALMLLAIGLAVPDLRDVLTGSRTRTSAGWCWPWRSRSRRASAMWPSSGWSSRRAPAREVRRLAWAEHGVRRGRPGRRRRRPGGRCLGDARLGHLLVADRQPLGGDLPAHQRRQRRRAGPRRSRRAGRHRHAPGRCTRTAWFRQGRRPSALGAFCVLRCWPGGRTRAGSGRVAGRRIAILGARHGVGRDRAQLAGARDRSATCCSTSLCCGRACAPSARASAAGAGRRLPGRLSGQPGADPGRRSACSRVACSGPCCSTGCPPSRPRLPWSCTTRSLCGCRRSAGRSASCACERRCRRELASWRPWLPRRPTSPRRPRRPAGITWPGSRAARASSQLRAPPAVQIDQKMVTRRIAG